MSQEKTDSRQHTTNSMQYAVGSRQKAEGRKIEFCLLLTPYSLLLTAYRFLFTPYPLFGRPTGSPLLPTPYPLPPNKGGFSLLEIIIVLAIIGLMAGALTPVALHLIGSKKAFASRDELQTLKKAMIGDPLATQWGSEATFGYIGDIGSLPTSLQDLYTLPPNVSLYDPRGVLTFNPADGTPLTFSTLGIGSGWRGPYVAKKTNPGTTDFLVDPYKNTYFYDPGIIITTDATLGAEVRATIRSPGPNRTDDGGTQDDLTERVLTTEVLTDVAGMIKNSEGAGIPTVSVTINYPSNDGTLTSSQTFVTEDGVTDSNGDGIVSPLGFYSFNGIPLGERAITLLPGLVYVPGTAYASTVTGTDCDGIPTGTTQTKVEFRVANLSSSDITVSFVRVYCAINPNTYYRYVRINNESSSRVCRNPRVWTEANTPVTLSPSKVVTKSTMQREPFRLLLQSSRIEIPDIELTTIGAGETVTVEIREFADQEAVTIGNPVDMAGIPFKIEFSNGSKAIFTPRKQL